MWNILSKEELEALKYEFNIDDIDDNKLPAEIMKILRNHNISSIQTINGNTYYIDKNPELLDTLENEFI